MLSQIGTTLTSYVSMVLRLNLSEKPSQRELEWSFQKYIHFPKQTKKQTNKKYSK